MNITNGDRVCLRWWERKDRRAIAHWPASEVPAHWVQAAAPVQGDNRVSIAVVLAHNAFLVGRITMRDIRDGGATVGIYLHPGHKGKGYGRESIALLCRYLFQVVGLELVRMDVAIDNERAIACYRAVQFQTVGSENRDGHVYLQMERRSASYPLVSGYHRGGHRDIRVLFPADGYDGNRAGR